MKDLSGRLARWPVQLQGYDYTTEHRKGNENVVADTLSRSAEAVTKVPEGLLEFETPEFESAEYQALLEQAHVDETAGHGGVVKTLETLRRQFYRPGMASQIRDWVRQCVTSKETKAPNFRMQVGLGQEVVTERPFQKLYIDFLGKYPRLKQGHAWIFVVVDHFSKFSFLKAMRETAALNVVDFLVSEVFYKIGEPEVIHSDNGRQFISGAFQNMISAFGISLMRTAVYAPQSNASDRVNRTVMSAIRAYLEQDHREWDLYLPEMEVSIRNAIHTATGVTPFFTVIGNNMFLNGACYKFARRLGSLGDHEISHLHPVDKIHLIRQRVQSQLHQAYERSHRQYNARARVFQAEPGQEVYRPNFVLSGFGKVFNAKFARKFLKARVVRRVGNNSFLLEDLQGKPLGVFHAKDIRVYNKVVVCLTLGAAQLKERGVSYVGHSN
ncbi:uncharacterized protein K02A2.6-like [Drosophila montana]|uniref:uncharacterized protein K02A2.6-like n=1 Tax=Drosophila montana TaxID=40370 RepID=UPI00313B4787